MDAIFLIGSHSIASIIIVITQLLLAGQDDGEYSVEVVLQISVFSCNLYNHLHISIMVY
jgi:hypothetical protein